MTPLQQELLTANEQRLRNTAYAGRLLGVGQDSSAESYIIGYGITGRSEGTKNRKLIQDMGGINAEFIDRSAFTGPNPELYEYCAIAFEKMRSPLVVSNGSHTDEIWDDVAHEVPFEEALARHEFEHDNLNTPRIAGYLDLGQRHEYALGIAKRSLTGVEANGSHREWQTFRYSGFTPGVGHFISTYAGEDDPVRSFVGEPYALALNGSGEEILEYLWDCLNPKYRVCLVVASFSSNFSREPKFFFKNEGRVPTRA